MSEKIQLQQSSTATVPTPQALLSIRREQLVCIGSHGGSRSHQMDRSGYGCGMAGKTWNIWRRLLDCVGRGRLVLSMQLSRH
jgi:hypothetical protein